jgi:hypothetical protein
LYKHIHAEKVEILAIRLGISKAAFSSIFTKIMHASCRLSARELVAPPYAFSLDCEWSLLSIGLDFRACERKAGTADNTQETKYAFPHNAKFPLVEIDTPVNKI